ncbi:MAG: hypothetical protein JWO43_282 [Candidatus Adlerbacteria bacterium]|nr:hypothetical protein [Candidatus Adlerbacteria bacterium]
MAQESGISWKVVTHEHKDRSVDWYWTLGVLTVVGVGLSIYFDNYLLALILIVGAISLGFLTARGPREHMVRIDSRGIIVDGTLHPYASVTSFGITEETHRQHLVVHTTGILASRIVAPIEGISPETVRMTLRRHNIEEIAEEPRFFDSVAEILGL